MNTKGLVISMGIGAAMGAVAIMMTPKHCTARKLANQAANAVEDAACKVTDKFNQALQ